MKAKYWEILLNSLYKIDKLNPFTMPEMGVGEIHEAEDKSTLRIPLPQYFNGKIDSVTLSTDNLDRILRMPN